MQERPYKSTWYNAYKIGSLLVLLPIIFIVVSMILANVRNSFVDIYLPLLQVISELVVLSFIIYGSLKIILHSIKNKIFNSAFYISIVGIISIILMITIGIYSAFLITSHSPIYNGVNLIWSMILLISSIFMFIVYKKDIKKGLIDDASIIDSNRHSYQYNNCEYNRSAKYEADLRKSLLTSNDYKHLNIFSSLSFVTIFAYGLYFIISYSLFSNVDELLNMFSYQNGILIPNWKLALLICISSFIFVPYLISTIGSFLKSKSIRKKVNLIDKNNNKNFINLLYYLSLSNLILFVITISIGLILVFISADPSAFFTIISLIVVSLIILIIIFAFSLKARKIANEYDYFNKSSAFNNL